MQDIDVQILPLKNKLDETITTCEISIMPKNSSEPSIDLQDTLLPDIDILLTQSSQSHIPSAQPKSIFKKKQPKEKKKVTIEEKITKYDE